MQWLGEIKSRYRSAQAKASVHINVEQLIINWQLGRDLVEKKAEERWGAGVVEQVSLDLQAAFPESKGFSTTNLWYMKQWYLFYSSEIEKLPQAAGELQIFDNHKDIKLPQAVGEIAEDGISLPKVFAFFKCFFPNNIHMVCWLV